MTDNPLNPFLAGNPEKIAELAATLIDEQVETALNNNQNDALDQALVLLGYREGAPSHHRSNLLHAIQDYAGLSGNEGLALACEARLNLIRAQNEAVHGGSQSRKSSAESGVNGTT